MVSTRHGLEIGEIICSTFGKRYLVVQLHWIAVSTDWRLSLFHPCKIGR